MLASDAASGAAGPAPSTGRGTRSRHRRAATRCVARSAQAGIAGSSTADPNAGGNFAPPVSFERIMTKLQGRRALVTGASRGIGAEIVRRLAADGAAVAFTYGRSAEEAEKLVAEVTAGGGTAVAIQADSADAEAVANSVDDAAAQLGGLDILVNNAGIAVIGDVESFPLETSTDSWRSTSARSSSRFSARSRIWVTAAASSTSAASTPSGSPARPGQLFDDQSRGRRSDARTGARPRAKGHHGQQCAARTRQHRYESRRGRIRRFREARSWRPASTANPATSQAW